MITAWHRSNKMSIRLDECPGVGPVLATALVATVADPKSFRSGRNFSAWIGLVPKQHSSGGKDRLGSISKQGDRYLRSLFVVGALAVIRYAKIHGTSIGPGSRHCWHGGQQGRCHALPTRSHEWLGRRKGERYKEPSRWRRNEIALDIWRDVKVGRANST